MKMTIRLFAAVVAAGLIGSCSFQGTETGSLLLTLPDEWVAAASGAKAVSWGTVDTMRLYLKQFSTFLPIQAAAGTFSDFDVQKTTPITGLQPGKGYQLLVAFGSGSSGTFHPLGYGSSEPFQITAGVSTDVGVTIWTSPFTHVTDAANASATVLGDGFYILAGDKILYGGDFASRIPLDAGLAGRTVNSLSTGLHYAGDGVFAEELWLNTSGGIVPYSAGTFDTAFMPESVSGNTVVSGAYAMKPLDGDPVLAIFFSGGGKKVGGGGTADFSLAPKDWTWIDFEGIMETADFAAIGDLLQDVTTDLIGSYALSAEYCIVVTPLNTFRFGMDLFQIVKTKIDGGDPIDATWIINSFLNNADAKTIVSAGSSGDTQLTISCVSTVDGSDGGVLFAGTQSGVRYGPIDVQGRQTGAMATVSGTAGYRITAIASMTDESTPGNVFVAALTSGGSLLLMKNYALQKVYPFHSGLPTGSRALTWNVEADGTLTLAVTGTGGAVVMKGIQ